MKWPAKEDEHDAHFQTIGSFTYYLKTEREVIDDIIFAITVQYSSLLLFN